MNKKQWMIPLSAFLLLGAAGCASDNNRAGVKGNNNLTRPIGYYSNENHPNNGNELIRDNDGAITEMMDHNLGAEDQVINEQNRRQMQTRDENGNPKNPTTPLAKKDRNFFQRDNRFSTSDMNYHGHLSTNMGNTGVATNPNFQDDFSNKIRNKVAAINNVQDVRSVAYGNTVIVSVKLHDNSKAADTKRAIKNVVKPYAKGRGVTVFTDEGAIGRDRNIHNDNQRNKGGR
ncbi:spore cortex protein CoxA [Neobacillus bataviensis LMG 21833]|uniref:Spore cortex protein CoxA n=1 Tax=Neobacillus bataviensis LMG 21833 TaxID=1117379 RepID=K6DD09_9BACI|nr:YhcN/YlaJ family sporulation lipoprotein [Neobacillus bataviensis]EKN66204.1 spore cortex protein CoxA [Neobacillus bataviensis LMG 21833]